MDTVRGDAPGAGGSIRPPSTAELLAGKMRAAIADGSMAPGAQLHQENLAAQFGVSRSPVREALRLLEAQGLVTYHPNRGAVVSSVSEDQVREIFEIRRLLESALIGRALTALTDRDIETLRAQIQHVEAQKEPQAWLALHRGFHDTIYAFARRARMMDVLNDNRLLVSELPNAASVVRSLRRAFSARDRVLVDALARRDAALAVETTLHHLSVLEERALARFAVT